MSAGLKIPIVFVTDNNYALPTGVALVSLLANKKAETVYEILIVGIDLAEEHRSKLEALSLEKAAVRVIGISSAKYVNYTGASRIPYVSCAAYVKFDIPALLPEYAKVIFLDCDILAQGDLTELFNTDLADKYAGAVRDIGLVPLVGVHDNYFNNGVMVLNLEMLRKDAVSAALHRLAGMRLGFPYKDQDIFNIVFYEKVVFLSHTYDYLADACGAYYDLETAAKFYDIDLAKAKAIHNKPLVIHFATAKKPWSYQHANFEQNWLEYYKISPYRDMPLIWQRQPPAVSIIIPVYNKAPFLRRCLDSLLQQTAKSLEIICIDDGSTDSSLGILYEYAGQYPQISALRQDHAGPGPARNRGMALARGEYLAFLDADDFILAPDALALMLRLGRAKKSEMVSANLKMLTPAGLAKNPAIPYYPEGEGQICAEDYGVPWFFFKNIFRRDFLQEKNIKFPAYFWGEDMVFLAEVLAQVRQIDTLGGDFYTFRQQQPPTQRYRQYAGDYLKACIDVFRLLNMPRFYPLIESHKKYIQNDFVELGLPLSEVFAEILRNTAS